MIEWAFIIIGIICLLVSIVVGIINYMKSQQQQKQQLENWNQRFRSGEFNKVDEKLAVFPFSSPELNQQVRLLLLESKKIKAIKLVRTQHPSVKLQQAKAYVEEVKKLLR